MATEQMYRLWFLYNEGSLGSKRQNPEAFIVTKTVLDAMVAKFTEKSSVFGSTKVTDFLILEIIDSGKTKKVFINTTDVVKINTEEYNTEPTT